MFSEMSHLTTSMYLMRPFTTPPVISPQQEVMYKMQNIHAERFLPIDQHMRRLRDTVDTKMPSERDLEQHNQFEFLRKQILRRLQVSVSFLRRVASRPRRPFVRARSLGASGARGHARKIAAGNDRADERET